MKIKLFQSLKWSWVSSLSILLLSIAVTPTVAAESLFINYSPLELELPVADLEIYAKEGRLTDAVAAYANLLTPEQLQQLRAALQQKIDLTPQTLTNFLTTPTGKTLLERASTIIQSKSEGASPQALQSALISAAADPAGLTVLSLLRHFPDAGIEVDVAQGVAIFQGVEQLVRQTNAAIAVVRQQANTAIAATPPVNRTQLQTLQQPGPYAWKTFTLQLQDNHPDRVKLTGTPRVFPVDIYLPQLPQIQPRPVIVLSHGLGSDRTIHAYFAKHLASHGFVVAAPEHPGSSARQIQALLKGKVANVSQPTEFVDRPLDIRFLLDDLTRRSQVDPMFKGRLNLDQVGVMGHSFGGYTALALMGAPINFAQLRQDCGPNIQTTLNISLLLQCQVLQLPEQAYDLADPRIKAAIAVSPLGKSVFSQAGLSQINSPIMLMASGADTIAPPLLEQIQPFTWLTESQKYLVLIEEATHFSTTGNLDSSKEVLKTPAALIGPSPSVARGYLKALGLAFFQAHVIGQPSAKAFLSGTSAQALSKPPFPLRLIQQLNAADLTPLPGQSSAN